MILLLAAAAWAGDDTLDFRGWNGAAVSIGADGTAFEASLSRLENKTRIDVEVDAVIEDGMALLAAGNRPASEVDAQLFVGFDNTVKKLEDALVADIALAQDWELAIEILEGILKPAPTVATNSTWMIATSAAYNAENKMNAPLHAAITSACPVIRPTKPSELTVFAGAQAMAQTAYDAVNADATAEEKKGLGDALAAAKQAHEEAKCGVAVGALSMVGVRLQASRSSGALLPISQGRATGVELSGGWTAVKAYDVGGIDTALEEQTSYTVTAGVRHERQDHETMLVVRAGGEYGRSVDTLDAEVCTDLTSEKEGRTGKACEDVKVLKATPETTPSGYAQVRYLQVASTLEEDNVVPGVEVALAAVVGADSAAMTVTGGAFLLNTKKKSPVRSGIFVTLDYDLVKGGTPVAGAFAVVGLHL